MAVKKAEISRVMREMANRSNAAQKKRFMDPQSPEYNPNYYRDKVLKRWAKVKKIDVV